MAMPAIPRRMRSVLPMLQLTLPPLFGTTD
jgi:hypothetical protein